MRTPTLEREPEPGWFWSSSLPAQKLPRPQRQKRPRLRFPLPLSVCSGSWTDRTCTQCPAATPSDPAEPLLQQVWREGAAVPFSPPSPKFLEVPVCSPICCVLATPIESN